jgi:single-strand DNA-binding protein
MSTTGAMLILRGFLGAAPQMRTTKTGEPVANFNLAIDQGYGERKTTAWVRVSAFGKLASAMEHLSKGDLVSVQSSTFRVATWQSQDNSPMGQLEVTAQRVDFIITKRGQAADTEADASN